MEEKRGYRKKKVGIVVSNKMDKSVVVVVERRTRHPVFKKYINRRKKFYAHDEKNECNVGDVVEITESRPLSRLKRWRVSKIIEKPAMV